MDKGTRMGPVVSGPAAGDRAGLHRGGQAGKARTLAAGGERVRVGDGKGYFVQPTVFTA